MRHGDKIRMTGDERSLMDMYVSKTGPHRKVDEGSVRSLACVSVRFRVCVLVARLYYVADLL